MKKILFFFPLLAFNLHGDILDDTIKFWYTGQYKYTHLYKVITRPVSEPDIIDDSIQYWTKVIKNTKYNYSNYKQYNPYRAAVIESLIESGAIVLTLVVVPEYNIVKTVMTVPKSTVPIAKSTDILVAVNKRTQLYISREAYEIYLLNSGRNVVFDKTRIVQRNIFAKSKANKHLMENGNAPVGYDGKPVELHHMKQDNKGTLVEVLSKDEHQKHTKLLHQNNKPSTIKRGKFNNFKQRYWKERVKTI